VSSGSGGLARLTFFSSRDLGAPGEAGGRFLRITYFVSAGEGGEPTLYRRQEPAEDLLPVLSLTDPEAGFSRPVRLTVVRRIALEYRDAEQWRQNWTTREVLPLGARLRITLPPGASGRSPSRTAVVALPRE
jgi:hypothetical protein